MVVHRNVCRKACRKVQAAKGASVVPEETGVLIEVLQAATARESGIAFSEQDRHGDLILVDDVHSAEGWQLGPSWE